MLSCPFKQANHQWWWREQDAYLWTIWHNMHINPELWLAQAKEFEFSIAWLGHYTEEHAYHKLKQIYEYAKEFRKDNPWWVYSFQCSEQIWWLWIRWEPDVFFIKWEDKKKLVIYDFKIVKDWKNYMELNHKYQYLFYSYMLWNITKIEDIEFVYRIYKKNKTIKLEEKVIKLKWSELEKRVEEIAGKYEMIVEFDNYYKNKWDHCFFCPLREKCFNWFI